ncbi:MAG: protein-L-isoaspartate(D-aspartate) O-methyltransferase [Deltaproteobacteria bacterium]|nr:protein-L-isoaspartate(D-aspartate) O-methyltransferase [Deltaproteobacteria bacterium]
MKGDIKGPVGVRVKKDNYSWPRRKMVDSQIIGRGIKQAEVINAMLAVPRHLFVEEALIGQAYSDFALPIGMAQTISQPYMAALMAESARLTGVEKALEIGTGSGYQSAVLSRLCSKLYSVERISALAAKARRTLDDLFASNVVIHVGDGTLGWPEHAPYDAIIVSAGAPKTPKAYTDQLAVNGRLIIPVGQGEEQELLRITRKKNGLITERLCSCRFVRLIGAQGWQGA